MTGHLLVAFAAAGAVALVLVPLLRWLALRVGFVDAPSTRKVHVQPMPYLGGVAIGIGVLAGIMVATSTQIRPAASFAGILVLAAAMGLLGLVDDSRLLGHRLRLAVQVVVAAVAVVLGVSIELTGLAGVDAVLTVVWIVVMTNSLNLLDNMDGLSAGVACTAAAGIAGVAFVGGLPVVGVAAASVVGATVGYLAYNIRPAVIFMGDAGAVFLGFLVAVLAAKASEAVPAGAPWPAVVPALVLAVAVVDTCTVVVARRRRGIPASHGGKDHLSHRLVGRGWAPGRAVAALVGTNAATAALAVAAVEGWLAPWTAAVLGAAVVAGVAIPAWSFDPYPPSSPGSGTTQREGFTAEATAASVPERARADVHLTRPGGRSRPLGSAAVPLVVVALVGVLMVGPAAVGAQADPATAAIRVSGTTRAGGDLVVSGSGFAPSTPVDLYLDREQMSSSTSGEAGTVLAEVRLPPDLLPGPLRVALVGAGPDGLTRSLSSAIVIVTGDGWGAGALDTASTGLLALAGLVAIGGSAAVIAGHPGSRRAPDAA